MQSNSHHTVQWSVGLSNGENAYEGVGCFAMVPGELSPWQKLMAHIVDKQLSITSIGLRTADGRMFSLPSAGRNPKFKAFDDAPKPIDYKFYRKIAGDVTGGEMKDPDQFTVIVALYDGYQTQLWVNEKTLNCWVLTA